MSKVKDSFERVETREALVDEARRLIDALPAGHDGPWPTMQIPLDYIDVGPNHRTLVDPVKLRELAAAIKSRGLEMSIRVHLRKGERFDLIFGQRRLMALEILKIDEPKRFSLIRAEILPDQPEAVIEEMQAIENFQRENPTVAEEAVAVGRMVQQHDGNRQIVADKLGKPLKWVVDRVYLHRLCKPVLNLVGSGRLPLAQGRLIATLGDPDDQIAIAGMTINMYQWASVARAELAGHEPRKSDVKELDEAQASGGRNVESVDRVKTFIAQRTRSLKVVGWTLDQRVGECGPCVGCPNNSKSDPVLFEGAADSDSELGFCMNQACFDLKQEFVEAAKAQALKTIEKAKSQPSAQAIREITPDGVKPETVQRFVKSQIDKPAEDRKSAGGKGEPKMTDGEAKLEALRKYSHALDQWRRESSQKIAETLPPLQCLALCIFGDSPLWTAGRYSTEYWNAKPPYLPPLMPPTPAAGILQAVKTIKAVDSAELQVLLQDSHYSLDPELANVAPNYLQELAKLLKVALNDVPTYEEFLPARLRPEPDPKPAAEPVKKGRGRPRKDDGAETAA